MCSSQELVHHTSCNYGYQLLATRLSVERLACAWPAVAKRVARQDPIMMDASATPATIACLAAQMPLVRACHLVVSHERTF